MKRTFQNLIAIALLVSCSLAQAAPVPVSKAKLYALQAFINHGGRPTTGIHSTDSVTRNGKTLYYIFNFKPGFVLLSADDAAKPVLGYSTTNAFVTANTPAHITNYLETYSRQLSDIVKFNVQATSSIRAEWASLKLATQMQKSRRNNTNNSVQAGVSPLLPCKWNQNPFFNDSCPLDPNNNLRAVTGCAATAMAQVLKFWQWPDYGIGSHSYNHPKYGTLSVNFGDTQYDWANMADTNLGGPNAAIATLMYHVGVGMDMEYGDGDGSSSAYTDYDSSQKSSQHYALTAFFGYKKSVKYVERSNFSDSLWMDMLKTDLDAGKPILYSGSGPGGGHAFVCDGYDSTDNFHFNWGWGGSSDGYYALSALNPVDLGTGAGNGSYNSGQDALINIEPNKPVLSTSGGLKLAAPITGSATVIAPGEAFSVKAVVKNSSNVNFTGSYTAAVFADGDYIDSVQTIDSQSLMADSSTGQLTFATTGIPDMIPGDYYVYIQYASDNDTAWRNVTNYGAFRNGFKITVKAETKIKLTDSLRTSKNRYYTNSAFSASAKVVNTSADSIKTDLRLDVYKTNGNFVSTLATNTGLVLGPGDTTAQAINFALNPIGLPAGTYNVMLNFKLDSAGATWQPAAEATFSNPVQITVEEVPLTADQYEPNDTVTRAAQLTATWSRDSAFVKSTGSNLHIGTDKDYYYIDLPAGFTYTLGARLQDARGATDGKTYTGDAIFRYSTDGGATFSPLYNSTLPGLLSTAGNPFTKIIFGVAPKFVGQTGTYLLDVSITRQLVGAVSSSILATNWKLYPNPAQSEVTLEASNSYNGESVAFSIMSYTGQIVKSGTVTNQSTKISLDGLKSGLYMVRLNQNGATRNIKLVLN